MSKKILKTIKNLPLASRKCQGKAKVYGIGANPRYYKLWWVSCVYRNVKGQTVVFFCMIGMSV